MIKKFQNMIKLTSKKLKNQNFIQKISKNQFLPPKNPNFKSFKILEPPKTRNLPLNPHLQHFPSHKLLNNHSSI